jgi:gliding motility-associated-like protein
VRIFLLFTSIIIILFCLPCKAQQVGGANYGNSGATGYITSCAGVASASPNIEQFTVAGNELTSNMIVSAPAYFEVSLSATSGFQDAVVITPSANGTINNTVIYVRSGITAPAGNLTGQCLITTSGFSSFNPIITATIYNLPTFNPVPDQTVPGGASTTAINFVGTANTYPWVNDTPGIGLAAIGTGNIPSFTAINTGKTPVTATIAVTPIAAGFAYVPNYGDGTVSVINTSTNALTGLVKIGSQPYGISLTADGTRAYVTNQGSNNVSVINTETNTVIATIPVGSKPTGLTIDQDRGYIYVTNEGDGTVSVIDIATNTKIQDIPVGSNPTGIIVNRDGSEIFVANSGTNTISEIDGNTTLVDKIVTVGQGPGGLALSPDGSTLYIANKGDNTVTVMNTEFFTIEATIPLGQSASPAGVALSPDGSLLYVTNYGQGTVSVITTATHKVTATINVGKMPLGVSISADGTLLYVGNYGSNTITAIDPTTNEIIKTVAVGTAPAAFGNFIKSATGCIGVPVKIKITVNPESYPNITATGTLSPLSTVYGTASATTSFTVSGTNMKEGILITPPKGFEVSTDGSTFSNTVTVGGAGTITPTVVYIRLASATPVGTYSGNIVLTSTLAGNVDVLMPESNVTPAPLTITADDKSRGYGAANPVLTITYSGFVNNDGPAQLTTQPIITTTAVTTSPVGQYPITASGALSPNYTFTYVSGVLTVNPGPVIPNAFTPNGDGVNDTWDIKYIDFYPNCTVMVFNRWGQNVYSSIGYGIPWNGTYRGAALPTSTYYYIIDLKNGLNALSGFLVIVR